MEQNKDLVIFWGSQSGTAEGFANQLARDIHRSFGIEVLIADLSDYDAASIARIPRAKLVIFIMATYGEGDPSDNANELWAWLGSEKSSILSSLRYAAFGLGNSNYSLFNRVIVVITQGLDRLGAQRLMPVGQADDKDGSTAEDFLIWKERLFKMFRDDLQYTDKDAGYSPSLATVEDDSMTSIDLHNGTPIPQHIMQKGSSDNSPTYPLPVKSAKELFENSTRNCLHIELDLAQYPELKYKTGDHLAVWPINPDGEVERLLQVLSLRAKRNIPISITSLDASTKTKLPSPTTVEILFRYYLDICGPLSRDAIRSVARFASTTRAKTLLTNLATDREAYRLHISRNYVNLGRLLESSSENAQTWVDIPLSLIIELLPTMKPRSYSISSSSIVHPRQATITAVVSTEMRAGDFKVKIPGLATNYMLALKQSLQKGSCLQQNSHQLTYALDGPGDVLENGKIHAFVRKSKFKLPAASSCPIIMVASGTGIAPFRGFLEERTRLKSMGREVGRTLLFFGCRSAGEDYLFQDEFASYKEILGDTLSIVTAFSRQEVNSDGSKVYVQDRIEQNFASVSSLVLSTGTYFYICGSADMARNVIKRMAGCFEREMGWDEGKMRTWLKQQKLIRRWQEDVWG